MAETPTPSQSSHKAVFFRQSGWLMFAQIAAGALMWAVHFFSKKIPESEYGVLGTLLALTMVIPVLPLQMVFAQQTAKALATGRERELAHMIRVSGLALFLVWVIAAGVMLLFQKQIIANWQISNPAALWVTLLVWLGALLLPMFWGLLQGKQDFLSLGWTIILNGAGRLGGTAVIVLVLGGYAAGIMTAVTLGFILSIALAIYTTRDLWTGPGQAFDVRTVLRQIIPLTLGFGACQFLFMADTMFVKAWFTGEETAFYVAAGTLSRALMWLVLPLAAVMFPKIVHSAARAEKTDLMAVTLAGTAVLAGCGALGLWLLGPYVVRFVYTPSYVKIATSLIPWYAAAMVPLSLGNVLVNNLLARSDFRPVPWLVLLAVGFAVTLCFLHESLVQVLQVLTGANTLFLVLCVLFTWVWKSPRQSQPTASTDSSR